MPAKYSLNSTNEFIDLIIGSGTTRILASLDVKNLFTNAPVTPNIKIIIEYDYSYPDIPPPNILIEIMEELLVTFTTKKTFRHPNDDIYLQVDGVSMGSPLGL